MSEKIKRSFGFDMERLMKNYVDADPFGLEPN